MEIRARYVLIGLFTFAVILLGFGFVYWLQGTGGLRERAIYRVRFENSVSGLLKGSAVLFNGVRVGEVVGLQLSADHPREVTATIAVDRTTPVHADTEVGLEFGGMLGGILGGQSQQTTGRGRQRMSKGELVMRSAVQSAARSAGTQIARAVLRGVLGGMTR